MDYIYFEKFAEKHGIQTVEIEGEMGCGYACSYVYYEPKSVIEVINKLLVPKDSKTGHYFDCSKSRTGVCNCGFEDK